MLRASNLSLIVLLSMSGAAHAETPIEWLRALQLSAKTVRIATAMEADASLDQQAIEGDRLRGRIKSWNPPPANPKAAAELCQSAALALQSAIRAARAERSSNEGAALLARTDRYDALENACWQAITGR